MNVAAKSEGSCRKEEETTQNFLHPRNAMKDSDPEQDLNLHDPQEMLSLQSLENRLLHPSNTGVWLVAFRAVSCGCIIQGGPVCGMALLHISSVAALVNQIFAPALLLCNYPVLTCHQI